MFKQSFSGGWESWASSFSARRVVAAAFALAGGLGLVEPAKADPSGDSESSMGGGVRVAPSVSPGLRWYLAAGPGLFTDADGPTPTLTVNLTAIYESEAGFGAGVFASSNAGTLKSKNDPELDRVSLLAGGGAHVQWLSPSRHVAPVLGMGVGYGYSLHFNPDRAFDTYSGSGVLTTARAGVIWKRGILLALRLEAPLFRMAGEDAPNVTAHHAAVSLEMGWRYPAL